MACFMFAINSFAWFVFMTNGQGHIDADVVEWDIAFINEESQVELIDIKIDDLYPGMPDFNHEVEVRNKSDLNATFSYEVEEVIVFGEHYSYENLLNIANSDLPFKITFSYESDKINAGDTMKFKVNLTWPFESEKEYYRLNDFYTFVPGCPYYEYNADTGEYQQVDVTEKTFAGSVHGGLYVESDDADTFWGEQTIPYKKEHPDEGVIVLKIKLIVSQNNE